MASSYVCGSNGFDRFGGISVNVKPLNTEVNRTLLATKVINNMTEEEVREFAIFILASSYDKDAEYFFSDWERTNNDADD